MLWRWDQGRLDYFRFESIRLIAKSLVPLNGVNINAPSGDLLREPLEQGTGLSFAPAHYRVWRNYARVFRAAGLATSIGDALVVTDLCRALARDGEDPMTADDYLAFLTTRFYFPSPAFDGWSDGAERVYPFCAVIKYLLNHRRKDRFAAITVRQVFGFLIGNNCTGNEPLDHYAQLTDTGLTPQGDQARQVRELLLFLSQLAFLQWSQPATLFLDLVPC